MKATDITPRNVRIAEFVFWFLGSFFLGASVFSAFWIFPKVLARRGRPALITAEEIDHCFQLTCAAFLLGIVIAVLFFYIARLLRGVRSKLR